MADSLFPALSQSRLRLLPVRGAIIQPWQYVRMYIDNILHNSASFLADRLGNVHSRMKKEGARLIPPPRAQRHPT